MSTRLLRSASARHLAIAVCLLSTLLVVAFGARTGVEDSAAVPTAALARRVPPSAGYNRALEKVRSLFRDEPVRVSGDKSLADLVSDRSIALALAASAPSFTPPAVPLLLHELKAWGVDASLSSDGPIPLRSGNYIVETLLSDSLCGSRTTRTGASFLVESRYGVHVVQTGTVDALGNRGESHYGQLAMVLGEAGVPSSAQVQVSTSAYNTRYTVRDILSDAVLRWKDDAEIEFFACAAAFWLPPHTAWANEFGDRYSFDSLMQQLISSHYGQGSCGGVHVPIAVATILNIDRNQEILSNEAREQGEAYLKSLSRHLEQRIQMTGVWDARWTKGNDLAIYQDSTLDTITVTGHHLEWIALAPASCRPSRSTIKTAIEGISSAFESLPPHRFRSFKSVLPSTHALRALCLLRCELSGDLWNRFVSNGFLSITADGIVVLSD